MSGTVNIARSIFDHELFADQPLTEREAWIWLIMEASWRPRKKRVGDYIVDLSRGQLAASVRFMAGAWKWTPARVQRFVKRLQNMEMICLKTDTGVSVITICNYDDYQDGNKRTDTGPIQDRYRTDTNEKKDARREEVRGEALASLAHVAEPSRFSDFWQQYPHRGGAKKGKASAQKVWDRLMKVKTPQDQIIAGAMRYAGDRQVLAGYAKDPSTWLNARGWEDEIETGVAPLGGTRHDRQSADRAFHQAIGQLADGLSAGTVQLDFASRDPFAQR